MSKIEIETIDNSIVAIASSVISVPSGWQGSITNKGDAPIYLYVAGAQRESVEPGEIWKKDSK